jgi:hypothetical protein
VREATAGECAMAPATDSEGPASASRYQRCPVIGATGPIWQIAAVGNEVWTLAFVLPQLGSGFCVICLGLRTRTFLMSSDSSPAR